jgi:hypothetical protein
MEVYGKILDNYEFEKTKVHFEDALYYCQLIVLNFYEDDYYFKIDDETYIMETYNIKQKFLILPYQNDKDTETDAKI